MSTTSEFQYSNESDLSDGMELTLQDLNDEEVRRRLAPIVYLAVLITIGLPGNITVLVVYATKFKPSTHRTFILALAVFDSVACAVCMPFEIIEMNYQYTFYAEGACKFFRFNNTFIALSSSFVLVFLSVDRYRKVCHPLRTQMTVRTSLIFCIVAPSLAAFFSWPIFFLLGTRHVSLRMNITGYDCSTADAFRETNLPFIHNAVLLLLFVIIMVTLILLYILIGKKVIKHAMFRQHFSTAKRSLTSSSSARTKSSSASDGVKNGDHELKTIEKKNGKGNIATASEHGLGGNGKTANQMTSNGQRDQEKLKSPEVTKPTKKITKIAFMISMMFILSYLPHLILTIMTAVKGGFVAKPGPVVSAVLPIVSRSIFINNVANAFIYSFYDQKFKRGIKDGFRRCFKCT